MRDRARYQGMGGRMYALANADRHVSWPALAMRNELHCKAEAEDPGSGAIQLELEKSKPAS